MKSRVLVLTFVCLSLGALRAEAQRNLECNPVDVASFGNRVHVRCNPGNGPIVFFAVSTENPATAQRFQDLALAALLNGKKLTIQYEQRDTTTGPAFGCASSDCRPALSILINR
jgi:hypothetical protein